MLVTLLLAEAYIGDVGRICFVCKHIMRYQDQLSWLNFKLYVCFLFIELYIARHTYFFHFLSVKYCVFYAFDEQALHVYRLIYALYELIVDNVRKSYCRWLNVEFYIIMCTRILA